MIYIINCFLLLIIMLNQAMAVMIDDFPYQCINASTDEAMPGHILRVGAIRLNPNGDSLVFVFPDEQGGSSLQSVAIAENAGIIGADIKEENALFSLTPRGSFVVAQIFVANEDDAQPIATCLSDAIFLRDYRPARYIGLNLGQWLPLERFTTWLARDDFTVWRNWRYKWRDHFWRIRDKYKPYKHDHRWSDHKRLKKDHKWQKWNHNHPKKDPSKWQKRDLKTKEVKNTNLIKDSTNTKKDSTVTNVTKKKSFIKDSQFKQNSP